MNYKALILVVALSFLAPIACNPSAGSGTVVREGVGIRDYYTLRSVDGSLQTRDVKPEPRPREAISGDDYFQVKLESIYIGKALGRDVGNLAIISEIEGILPPEVSCNEIDVADLGFKLEERERHSHAFSSRCSYKHVVALNPVFQDGHTTFDSRFISPPFRMGKREIGLRFIIGQLNDVEMARMLLQWSQEQLNNLDDWGIDQFSMTKWQSKLVDIGFTVANYIIDYAAKPDYVFDFQTDFVPIESVGGVSSPQNLLMGGDFVIVGFANTKAEEGEEIEKAGALEMADRLVFDSGRLYWKGSKKPFEDGPYIIYKVVRQSRYPRELPVSLAKINRLVERGESPDDVTKSARGIVLDLQDANMLNETEGRYYLDVFDWYAHARGVLNELEKIDEGEQLNDKSAWPVQLQTLPAGLAVELAVLDKVAQAQRSLNKVQERVYDKYSMTPGITIAECTQIQSVTDKMVDVSEKLKDKAQQAHDQLAIRRQALQTKEKRTPTEESELQALIDAELWASGLAFGESFPEPRCPSLRD